MHSAVTTAYTVSL